MSTARTFLFHPNDTLMFREGFPFNQHDEGASAAESLFPPYPPTLVGALRFALASQMGFPSKGWPTGILGNGVDWQAEPCQLGPLSFGPPCLLRHDPNGATTPLFPAPLHLAQATNRQSAAKEMILLSPGPCLNSDIGAIRFPGADMRYEAVKPLEGHFLTENGICAIIAGKAPGGDDVLAPSELWTKESRVGIGINAATRRVHDGALYTAAHVRLRDDITISIDVDGLEDNFDIAPVMQVLGGEHRMAMISQGPRRSSAPSFSKATETPIAGRFALCALSPVCLDMLPAPGQQFDQIPGSLVSAAIGKPIWAGGWNSLRGRPIPMRQLLPAGSVFFLESEDAQGILPGARVQLGKATGWGFGHAVVIHWRQMS